MDEEIRMLKQKAVRLKEAIDHESVKTRLWWRHQLTSQLGPSMIVDRHWPEHMFTAVAKVCTKGRLEVYLKEFGYKRLRQNKFRYAADDTLIYEDIEFGDTIRLDKDLPGEVFAYIYATRVFQPLQEKRRRAQLLGLAMKNRVRKKTL